MSNSEMIQSIIQIFSTFGLPGIIIFLIYFVLTMFLSAKISMLLTLVLSLFIVGIYMLSSLKKSKKYKVSALIVIESNSVTEYKNDINIYFEEMKNKLYEDIKLYYTRSYIINCLLHLIANDFLFKILKHNIIINIKFGNTQKNNKKIKVIYTKVKMNPKLKINNEFKKINEEYQKLINLPNDISLENEILDIRRYVKNVLITINLNLVYYYLIPENFNLLKAIECIERIKLDSDISKSNINDLLLNLYRLRILMLYKKCKYSKITSQELNEYNDLNEKIIKMDSKLLNEYYTNKSIIYFFHRYKYTRIINILKMIPTENTLEKINKKINKAFINMYYSYDERGIKLYDQVFQRIDFNNLNKNEIFEDVIIFIENVLKNEKNLGLEKALIKLKKYLLQ